jgi:hypothetical protein
MRVSAAGREGSLKSVGIGTIVVPTLDSETTPRFTAETQRPYRNAGSSLLNSCLQHYT